MWRCLAGLVLSGLLAMAADRPATVEEMVKQMTSGTMVEVRRKEKGSKKLRGRLGVVTAAGFAIESTDTVNLAFGEVKSIQVKEGKGRRGLTILAGVGVGLGVVLLIGVAAAASL